MEDSEKYFTKLVDGQLSVATVAQSGEIIPEESRPGDKYTTALVQTDNGPQLCVKIFDPNGGGGGGTVDQTYDPTSTNAQSGTAVAEAVAPKIQNESTYSGAVCIGGYDKTVSTHKGNAGSILIGENAYSDANSSSAAVVIGKNSAGGAYAVTLGTNAGSNSYDKSNATIVGAKAEATTNSVSIGAFSRSIGTITNAITIGGGTSASNCAKSSANGAIQLGTGENSTANSFQVFTFQMLDGTTGKIPMARLPIVQCTQAEYDALVSGGTVDSNTIYCIIPA